MTKTKASGVGRNKTCRGGQKLSGQAGPAESRAPMLSRQDAERWRRSLRDVQSRFDADSVTFPNLLCAVAGGKTGRASLTQCGDFFHYCVWATRKRSKDQDGNPRSTDPVWTSWFWHEEQARLHHLVARGWSKYTSATGEHDSKAEIVQYNKIAEEGTRLFYALADQAMRILQGVNSPKILSRLRQENRRLEGSQGWIMLLFEAAWEHPKGSALWASKTIPWGDLMQLKAREQGKTLTTIEVIDEIEHVVRGEITPEDFLSVLPTDPFSASVLLIDILLEAGEPSALPTDLIDIKGVAELVHKSPRTIEKRCVDWPKPIIPGIGNCAALYSYAELLPVLRKQYPGIKLSDALPAGV